MISNRQRPLLVCFIAALLALSSYFVSYHYKMVDTTRMLCHEDPKMEWLRKEYQLNDEQYEKINARHKAFQPICEAMCKRIDVSKSNLKNLVSTNSSLTPEIQRNLLEIESLHTECRRHTLEYVFDVSKIISPESGKKYLERILPQVLATTQSDVKNSNTADCH